MVPFGCPTYLKTSCVWMPSCSWWPFAFHRMTTTQHTTRTSPSQPVNEEQDLMCPLRQTHYYTLRPPEVLREVNTASHVSRSELKGLDSYLLFIVPALIESRVTSASGRQDLEQTSRPAAPQSQDHTQMGTASYFSALIRAGGLSENLVNNIVLQQAR